MPLKSLSQNIQTWPLWWQLLLVLTGILVTHFWLGKLIGSVQLKHDWFNSPYARLVKFAGLAAALSWLITNYCIGSNAVGTPYEWGF